MSTADEDLARVTVISPTRRVDLALPGTVTLGELLPSVVRFSGHEAGTPQDAVHGWVLQRFGEDPLDPNSLVSKLAIRDGETLYLRQRDNAMPDAAFDDVVDAVSSTTTKRPSWRAKHSQSFAIAALVLVLVGLPLAVMILQFTTVAIGKRGYFGSVLDLLLALAAGIAAIALSRAAGQFRVAAALAWSSVALAGMGGFQLVDVADLPVRLVMAAAMVLLFSTAMALAAAVTTMALFTAAVSSGLVLTAAIVSSLLPRSDVKVAAVAVALLLATTSMMPTLSYQLARIQLPNLPNTAEGILADDEPVQSDIVSRALLADRLLGALLTATGLALVWFCSVLVWQGGWWRIALGAAAGLALLLRAREFVGLTQRLALLIPGVIITTIAALAAFQHLFLPLVWQVVIIVAVVTIAAVSLTHFAAVGYAKFGSPMAGRMADVVEWLAVISVVPLTLGVLGTYGWVQTLWR